MKSIRLLSTILLTGLLFAHSIASAAESLPGAAAGRGPMAMKRGKPEMYGPDYRLEMMGRRLGLTAEQKEKIKPILTEEYTQIQALRGNDSYNRDERRARLQELNQSTYDKIRPILTKEQQMKHEIARKTITENRSKIRSTRPGPNPGENDPENRLKRLTLDLALTPEQQSSIKPILMEEFTQLEALRGNDVYNREQRRAKLLQLNQASYEKIKELLTPEQQTKYNNITRKIVERRTQSKDPATGRP